MYEHKDVESFYIKQRYEHHNREFLTHIDKHIKYPASFFTMMAKSTRANAPEIYEAIYNSNLRNDERMIFQKIYNDLDESFEE